MTNPRASAPQGDYQAGPGPEPLRIWDGVPLRNPAFTGREALLRTLLKALDRRSKASVLPHALHGLGGVGKTQLAVEFAYRYADRYDVVWWIPAEQQTLVLQSLRDLGKRLGTPETANLQHSAGLVLEQLSRSSLRWLLIYDNANDPDDVASLIPEGGGHVILTSRNQTWSNVWDPIEVDVFDRPESIELVQKRSADVSAADAEQLAERLGDLPLALDQAALCQSATGMPADEYLAELDARIQELSATQQDTYQRTIAALVKLALDSLRRVAPPTAELLELFAQLGAEPISGGLLRRGRDAHVSPALKSALVEEVRLDRAIRQLSRYGLARVDADKRVQVHRLFQLVLWDLLDDTATERSRTNVHRVLASANPGYPGLEEFFPIHAEIGPHIGPAGLVESELTGARRVVLDQVRYLQQIGDLEGARRLGETAFASWSKAEDAEDLGPNGELTLRVSRSLAAVLRLLGFNERARTLIEDAYERLRTSPEFGPDHEYTLGAAQELAPNRRVAGEFREALELDQDTLERSRRLFGEEDPETLYAVGNLAVNLRMLSNFSDAEKIDADAVESWQQSVSDYDNRLLFAQVNLARDQYGLGKYAEALTLLQRVLSPFREQLGSRHPWALLAGRTMAMTLRKVGQYDQALAAAEEHHLDTVNRYGQEHEHSLVAAMTLANSLRVTGDLARAGSLASDAVERYRRVFGEGHPLTLAAWSNYAVVLRNAGDHEQARKHDDRTYARMRKALGDEHGYTVCVMSGLGNDYAAAGDAAAARRWSELALTSSQGSRGEKHPYTLACKVNAALDVIADGDVSAGRAQLDQAVAGLAEVVGPDHPETLAAAEQVRAECDIEPPPT